MAQLPGLFERADGIKTTFDPHEALAARLALVDRCWALHRQLEEWHRLAHGDSDSDASPQYWPQFATMHNPADDEDPELGKVFPTALHFPNLRIATRYLYYWTSVSLLYSIITISYQSLSGGGCDYTEPEHPADRRCPICSTVPGLERCKCGHEARVITFDVTTLPPPPKNEDFHLYAGNVAQSVEYCLLPENGYLGSITIIFPFASPRNVFATCPEEVEPCVGV